MHGFIDTRDKKFHPITTRQSAVHASDIHQENIKVKSKSKREQELDKFFGGRNRKKMMEELIKHKLKTDKFGNKILEMDNSRLDFKGSFVYQGVTKSGNVKLGNIWMSSPEGLKTKTVIAKPALSSGGHRELYVLNWSFIESL